MYRNVCIFHCSVQVVHCILSCFDPSIHPQLTQISTLNKDIKVLQFYEQWVSASSNIQISWPPSTHRSTSMARTFIMQPTRQLLSQDYRIVNHLSRNTLRHMIWHFQLSTTAASTQGFPSLNQWTKALPFLRTEDKASENTGAGESGPVVTATTVLMFNGMIIVLNAATCTALTARVTLSNPRVK